MMIVVSTTVQLEAQTVAVYKDNTKSINERVEHLLSIMTIEEKVGQLNQLSGGIFTGPAANDPGQKAKIERLRNGSVGSFLNVIGIEETQALQRVAVNETRLGIPLLFAFDVIHGYKTIFPIPLAEACAWDAKLAEKAAEIAAKEAASSGLHWTFAPMADVSRDPRWGRVMENAGEDAYLAGVITEARIRGFQKNIASKTGLMATLKHFAAYGAVESGREYNTVDVSRVLLFNYYLPTYKAALKAKPAAIMNSFNFFEGIPVSGNHFLNTEILQNQWKFEGFMVSDWNSFGEMVIHGFAENRRDAAKKAFLSGSMVDMESSVLFEHLPDLVKTGEVPLALVDSAVAKVLYWKFKLGLFENPFGFGSKEAEKNEVFTAEHRAIARIGAQKSAVLLKNEASVLPINPTKKIVLLGEFANDKTELFDFWIGKGEAENAVSMLEGMKAQFPNLRFEKGYQMNGELNELLIQQAINAAKKADVLVVAIGISGKLAGEDRSLTEPVIPQNQIELLKALKKTGKPIVAIVMSGRPLILTPVLPLTDAILQAWILGTESGNAVADLISGKVNPSAKTVMTFPEKIGQIPIYYNHFNTGRPKPSGDASWTSRYRDVDNEPLFPFGYGLSYTRYSYSELTSSSSSFSKQEPLKVSVLVKNEGKMDGEEIVQLYVRDMVASIVRPVKELKGFKKIHLKAGESARVEFELKAEECGFYNDKGEYLIESGAFEVFVGTNSRDTQKVSVVLN